MFGPVRGRWKDGCRCGLRGWPPDGGAQRVFRERAAVECRAPAAEADVRHLRGGAAVGWRTEGSGRCVVGAGRVLECRASGVVPRTGGAGSSGSRAGVGPVSGRCGPLGAARAGVDSLFRRGRHGAAAVPERGRSHPPDARPPIFARSALRKGPDAPFSDSFCPFLQRPAAPEPTPFANPRFRRSGKAKKLFFYFYFIIKDVSLCSQNNT